jgi:hypothetical protein
MPKGKRSARASWLFRNKPAVASANTTYGRFNVSINFDEPKAEGSIVIQHAVYVEGFPSEQTLDLLLRPESIIACELFPDNQNQRLPPEVLNLIPTNRNDVWSLSLTMRSPGTVICPTAPLPLSFLSTSFGQQFAAFSHLCQTTYLQIYLGNDQLQPEHRTRLGRFASAIALRQLRANPIDLRSLGGGGGKQETTWDYIHRPDEQQAGIGACKKRSRDGESLRMRSPRVREYIPHVATEMHSCFLDQRSAKESHRIVVSRWTQHSASRLLCIYTVTCVNYFQHEIM